VSEEDPVFQIRLGNGRIVNCSCAWARVFEGEILGNQYYRINTAKRCPAHGKPRHEKGKK
jgi:hypothetical protein